MSTKSQRVLGAICIALMAFSVTVSVPSEAHSSHDAKQPTLYFLSLRNGVQRLRAGEHQTSALTKEGTGPDGIAIDANAGHVYWTNMGKVSADDGSILRSDFDGGHVTTIVPVGGTFTPKQLKLDATNKKLYWSDREGMRVMRSDLDGTHIETLIITGTTEQDRHDQSRWCVGIAVDAKAGKFYWSQKGGDNAHQGTLKRANIKMRDGENAAHRSDVEVLFSGLPEPIDLDIDSEHRLLYWTDRGDNTVSRAPLDPHGAIDSAARSDRQILVRDLKEAIGIALDVKHNRMYYTDLGGNVGTAALDGANARMLLTGQGALTGIALLEH